MTLPGAPLPAAMAASRGAARGRARAPVSDSSYGAVHNLLGLALLAFLALEPLALGGNRPVFWTGSTLVLAGIAALYSLTLLLRGQGFRVPLSKVGWEAALFALTCLFLLVQVVPLGGPYAFATAAGGVVQAATLSLAPGSTIMLGVQFAGYGLCFFLMFQIAANRSRARLLLAGLFAIVTAYAVLGLYMLTQLNDTFFGVTKIAYLGSATATFVNRNSYSTFLAMGFCIGWALLVDAVTPAAERPRPAVGRAALILAAQAFILTALIATNSRMGMFSGVAGSLLVLGLGATKMRLGAWAWLVALGLGLAALGGLLWLFGGGLIERLGSLERAADVRNDLYAQIWHMIGQRPLLGYGGGAFELAYPLFHQPPVSSDLIWDKAHSTYLGLWADLGLVVGSAPMLLVAVQLVRALWHFLRRARGWLAPLAVLGVGTDVALHSLVDFSLEIPADAYLFVSVLALAAASSDGSSRAGGR
jgi:O-antigen ligase